MESRIGRTAPARFARGKFDVDPAAYALWRGLTLAFVPERAWRGTTGPSALGYDVVSGYGAAFGGGVTLRGEASGPAFHSVGAGAGLGTTVSIIDRLIPEAAPFSGFAFVVRRDSSGSLQSMVGNGFVANGGWTWQMSYGTANGNRMGLTRWGVADEPLATMAAVDNSGLYPSCIGFTHNGSTARFFKNGTFEDRASGAPLASSTFGTGGYFFSIPSGSPTPLQNCAVHVLYLWNRLVRDAEFMTLLRDPFLPVRPAQRWMVSTAGAGGASGARVFIPAFIG